MSQEVLLALGSNIGDKAEYINKAIVKISELDLKILKSSSLYKSEPYGYQNQDWFINSCILIETEIEPLTLLKKLKEIEVLIGRKKRERWHEREIDIDIILYGNSVLDKDNLQLPHPEMEKRNFVLLPASEIAPEMIHPINKKKLLDLSQAFLDDPSIAKYQLNLK